MKEESSTELDLKDISDNLHQIEAIMIAENKRRVESNQIMSKFIDDYL